MFDQPRKLMHEFFRMGREEKAKQLAETEDHRRRVDRRLRNFHQRLEDRFVEQTAAKVSGLNTRRVGPAVFRFGL